VSLKPDRKTADKTAEINSDGRATSVMHDCATTTSSARVSKDRTDIFPALYPLIEVAKNNRPLSISLELELEIVHNNKKLLQDDRREKIYLQFNYYASLRYKTTLTTSACANYSGEQLYF